jgi:hypothetical protein
MPPLTLTCSLPLGTKDKTSTLTNHSKLENSDQKAGGAAAFAPYNARIRAAKQMHSRRAFWRDMRRAH